MFAFASTVARAESSGLHLAYASFHFARAKARAYVTPRPSSSSGLRLYVQGHPVGDRLHAGVSLQCRKRLIDGGKGPNPSLSTIRRKPFECLSDVRIGEKGDTGPGAENGDISQQ